MTLSTYAQIKDAVAFWLDRPDLDVILPGCVRLAETRLSRLLFSHVNMVRRANWTFSDGSRSLPEDFNGIISLSVDGLGGLEQVGTAQLEALPVRTGTPSRYAISAGNIQVWPAPDAPIVVTAQYRIKLDALALGPNWLLESHPDAYLFGALVEAAGLDSKETRGGMWRERFETAISEINDEAHVQAYSGPLQLQSANYR